MVKWKIHSQNYEECWIAYVLKRLRIFYGVTVEFGGQTSFYCSNTKFLQERGWTSYFYDLNPRDELVTKKFITEANVNDLPKCDVLSIDVDGEDYNIWKAYTGTPLIVVIEIDSGLDPEIDSENSDGAVNFSKMLKLGKEKGYFLLKHTGNMIFVRNEYAKDFDESQVDDILKFDRSWLPAQN